MPVRSSSGTCRRAAARCCARHRHHHGSPWLDEILRRAACAQPAFAPCRSRGDASRGAAPPRRTSPLCSTGWGGLGARASPRARRRRASRRAGRASTRSRPGGGGRRRAPRAASIRAAIQGSSRSGCIGLRRLDEGPRAGATFSSSRGACRCGVPLSPLRHTSNAFTVVAAIAHLSAS